MRCPPKTEVVIVPVCVQVGGFPACFHADGPQGGRTGKTRFLKTQERIDGKRRLRLPPWYAALSRLAAEEGALV